MYTYFRCRKAFSVNYYAGYLRYGLSDKDGEEKTQKEVADMLGISQSYISRLEKKIIKRLKREMVRSC